MLRGMLFVLLSLAAAIPCIGDSIAAGDEAAWDVARTVEVAGAKISLSTPRLVARRREYLWFPTLVRRDDGRLLAVMSDYADAHVKLSTALMSESTDGGLTWGEPIPSLYGDVAVHRPTGDVLLLPYYLQPRDGGAMGGPYVVWGGDGPKPLYQAEDEIVVYGWPRTDKPFAPDLGTTGFVWNGQCVPSRDSGYLGTLYGFFEGASRMSIALAESQDGVRWSIRSIVADETCRLEGGEGPCEVALTRLADGRLMVVFRLASYVTFGQSFSSDDGRTWTEPANLEGTFSVQPSLAMLESGPVLLSGGRRGIFLWIDPDGDGQGFSAIDLVANHNACLADEPIDGEKMTTSSYTEVVATGPREALVIYDRIPHSWHAIPEGSADTNSVWVVRATVEAASP
jgi:hypothetical protein